MHGDSKSDVAGVERVSVDPSGDAEMGPIFDQVETKRVLRKIDFRVVPLLTLLYIFSFLDRSNIGNAKIAGMMEDLDLAGWQYNTALTVFFVPYVLFEIPSNMVLKVIRPSRWITIMIVSWGTVVTLQGIVQSFSGLVATRFFLGFCEAGFFPAASYLLTTWYCRFEVQTRMAIFFSSASLASAFSGLLAFGIQQMAGVGGLGGWRWIFILEGIATVVIGGSLALMLPDSPETCGFLTEEEKRFIAHRLSHDGGTEAGEVGTKEKFNWYYLKAAMSDWRIYMASIVYWGNSICLYGFNYTAPSIILQLGYTTAIAQLLTVPLYMLGVVTTLIVSVWSDRVKSRWPFIVGPYCITMLAFVGLLSIPHPRLPGLTYGLLFAIPAGGHPPLLTCLAWVGNNLAPSWKRSIGMALFISIGNMGGIVGSNIFLEAQAPHYWTGYGICVSITLCAIVAALGLRLSYRWQNAKRDRMSVEEVREKYSREELIMMGDRSPVYRYVL